MTTKEEFTAERFSPRRWLAPALLVAVVVLVYWNSLRIPFLFDDAGAIVNNPTIRHLWSLDTLNPPGDGSTTTGRPVVNFSYALNYAISGEHVWSYHALNVTFHALAALTLFGFVRRTIRSLNAQPSSLNSATLVAFTTALIWALHPLQTESVVCIAQRTESLCGLCFLLTLYAFARAAESSSSSFRWLVLSVVSCLAGMGTKEVMVTAPVVVLLYDRTFFARSFSAALRKRRAYYSALASTWLLLVWLISRGGGARGVAAGFGLGISPWHYLLTQCDALVLYLKLAIWPHPLVLDYGNAVAHSLAEVWWQALTVLALLAIVGWALVRNTPFGFVGAVFFLILAPSSSVVPLVTQTIAEHRMYLPLSAVVSVVTMVANARLGRRAVWLLAAVAFGLGDASFLRNRDYASELAIWQDNVAHRPHARVLTALGAALLHAGRASEALPHFERALALDPSHLSAQRNRALALLQLGRTDEATAILAVLPSREPGEAEEYFALGNAFAREQKFDEASAAYGRTLALEPAHAGAHANLGNILLLQGRPREAIGHYEEVLRLQPDDQRARENLQLARESLR